jgi:hypothetical protein
MARAWLPVQLNVLQQRPILYGFPFLQGGLLKVNNPYLKSNSTVWSFRMSFDLSPQLLEVLGHFSMQTYFVAIGRCPPQTETHDIFS